jgi:hypothetical protein
MNAFATAVARKVTVVRRVGQSKVRVEVGNGAIAPKVALHRTRMPVKVEVGNGAIAPKVALHRTRMPVKVEVGNGAIAPKVAIHRGKGAQQD